MAKKSIYRGGRVVVGFNMTPMIDCTFQLIIFFMLVTQMVSADYVQMDLPDPVGSRGDKLDEPNKVIINIVPHSDRKIAANRSLSGRCKEYSLGILRITKGDKEKLKRVLMKAHRDSKRRADFVVELRADQDLHYNQITPVLEAVRDAQLEKLRITVLKRKHGG